MADDTTLADTLVAIIAAALSFFHAEDAFGPAHDLTAQAKARLREVVANLVAEGGDDERPALHVVRYVPSSIFYHVVKNSWRDNLVIVP